LCLNFKWKLAISSEGAAIVENDAMGFAISCYYCWKALFDMEYSCFVLSWGFATGSYSYLGSIMECSAITNEEACTFATIAAIKVD
jgi:hypothetical protein